MKSQFDSPLSQHSDGGMVDAAHRDIKQECSNLPPQSLSPEEQKLNSIDVLNISPQHGELKVMTPSIAAHQQAMAAAVMHNPSLLAGSLHPLHHAPPMPQMANPALTAAHQHVSASVDNNSCAIPEFELARRLGVRFDSSNAAWVARWTDAQNERKKSRWFSVAKYGNAPARRLAIQACLHNMKPSDFPSLRDLQDVLATFGHPGTPGPPSYLVSGADMAASGMVRSGGMVDPHHMASKLGAQFGSPHQQAQFMPPHHHNPFAPTMPPGMLNPMASYAMGMGMHPAAAPANIGIFVQGVPQQHACQGVAPQSPTSDFQSGQEEVSTSEDLIEQQQAQLDADGQPLIKTESAYIEAAGVMDMEQNAGGAAAASSPPQVIKALDQTTTAASSVGSPSANNNGGIKQEDNNLPHHHDHHHHHHHHQQHQQQQQPGDGSDAMLQHTTSQGAGTSSADDAAFLQSLSAQVLQQANQQQTDPAAAAAAAAAMASRFVLSSGGGGHCDAASPSQESSDLDTRSIGSHSDDEDDEDDGEDKDDDEDGGDRPKRKKRKLQGNDEEHEHVGGGDDDEDNDEDHDHHHHHQQQQHEGGTDDDHEGGSQSSGGGAFGHHHQEMNVYSPRQGSPTHQGGGGSQQGMQGGGMNNNNQLGQQSPNYNSYFASLYGGYPSGAQQQQMLLQQQMNGQSSSQQGGLQPSQVLPMFLQPQVLPMLHPHHFQQHAAVAAAAGFLPPGVDQSQYHHLLKQQGMYFPQGYGQQGGDDGICGFKRHGHNGGQSASGGPPQTAKMTCERGLHYSKCYRGAQECWIAVWNTKGGRIMHEAFDVVDLGFEIAKQKAREARDAAHSNNVAVTENSRPSWKSHSNTGIPHVSLDSQQLRFRAHKFGRRLCRSFSFGRRRGSYASRESAFDAAVLWLIQTPTEEEIAAVSGCSPKIEEM